MGRWYLRIIHLPESNHTAGCRLTPVDITAYNSRIRAHSFVGEIAEFSISKDTLPLGWLALDGTTYTGGEDRYSDLVDVNSFFVRTNDNSPDLVAPGDILLLEMPDFLRAIGSTHNRVGGVIMDQEPTVEAWPSTMPDHYHLSLIHISEPTRPY